MPILTAPNKIKAFQFAEITASDDNVGTTTAMATWMAPFAELSSYIDNGTTADFVFSEANNFDTNTTQRNYRLEFFNGTVSQGVFDETTSSFTISTPFTYDTIQVYAYDEIGPVNGPETNVVINRTSTTSNRLFQEQNSLFALERASTRLYKSFCALEENGVTYAWNFGDGNTSSDKDVVHQYANTTNETTYTVTLTITYANGSTATDTMDVTVTAEANGTFPVFEVLVRPNSSGQPIAYVDGSTLADTLAFNWFDEASSLTTRFGTVNLTANEMQKITYQANGNKFTQVFTPSQVSPKDNPKASYTLDINLLTLTFNDTSVAGSLGIGSVQAIITNQSGTVGTVSIPTGGSASYSLPASGAYRIMYRLTTNPHPSTGNPDVFDSVQMIGVSNTLGTVGTLLTANIPELNMTGQNWTQAYTLSDISGLVQTVRWQDGNGSDNGITSAIQPDRSQGSYVGQDYTVRGGVQLSTNDVSDDVNVVKEVTGFTQVPSIRAYHADPFHNQNFGFTNPDFSSGTTRGQTSANIRGNSAYEQALASSESHLSIYAWYVFFNRDFHQDDDGVTKSPVLGGNNSVEGFQTTSRISEHLPIVNIMQGMQDKRTVSPQGSPSTSIDVRGTILIQADDVGVNQNSDTRGMPNDYATGNINGRRVNAAWPIKTTFNRTGYLMIKAILKDGNDGMGQLKYWVIPLGDEGINPSLHIKPIFDYTNAVLYEPGAGPGQTNYAHVDTFGHYDARAGTNLWTSMRQSHLQTTREQTQLFAPHTYAYSQIGNTSSLSMPNDETILASVFTHYGINY